MPVIPPAPPVHARDLPTWRVIREMGRNSVGIWSERAFDELVIGRRAYGVSSMLMNDPAGVRRILGAGSDRYQHPVTMARVTRPLAGDGLLLAEGDAWRRQRRLLAPAFTPAALDAIVPHFVRAGRSMVGLLEDRREADLSSVFQDVALDAVLRALFSLPLARKDSPFTAMARAYLQGPGRVNVTDAFAQTEDSFAFASGSRRRFAAARRRAVADLVAARRREISDAVRGDLVSRLMSARDTGLPDGLSDAEIGEQAATFLFAGFETTARLLFWATYLLTLDTTEQQRITAEVRAFPPEAVTSLADLQRWPRLRLTLLEALRLYPPAPNILRVAVADDEVSGERIAKGTQVWMSPWVMHRHRKLWDEPTAFLPDRFSGRPAPWTSVEGYLPFGGGPRVCIGALFAMAEAQIILASLLSRFDVSLPGGVEVLPVATVTTGPSREPLFTLAPAGGEGRLAA